MKKAVLRIFSVLMTVVISLSVLSLNFTASAKSVSEFQKKLDELNKQASTKQSEITKLKNDNSGKAALKAALEAKISLIQQQIDLCNSEISKINSTIAANKAEIEKKNQEIDADKLAFKKRIRAIYMSNQSSSVQILLGADSFSDYLQLSQLTSSVSAHDKLMIEKIVAAVQVLQEKQKENEELLKEQVDLKATNAAKQKEIQQESNEIQSLINSNNEQISDNQEDIKDINAEKNKVQKEMAAFLASLQSSNSGHALTYDGGAFTWPAPGITRISSGFGSRWGTSHNGVDVSNGSFGNKVVAIADGYVYQWSNHCTHNYGKSSDCCGISGQGKGYGNYVAIDHGSLNGKSYKAFYAHMSTVTVANGAFVKKGQVIGYIGSTGYSTGPHLHFGLMVNNSWVNPMSYFRAVS